ncbi:maltose acetyltransferase domain-containing protein, partial [Acinetobacter baumannii]|nr:maltose acetyltransferase domain-containing protein [Acinetobacter baumannii]
QSPDGYVAQNRNVPPEVKAKAQSLCWEYNQTPPDQPERRQDILSRLLGTCHPLTFIEPAFHGVPTYDIKQGVAWDNIPFTDDIKEIAANAGAVCW